MVLFALKTARMLSLHANEGYQTIAARQVLLYSKPLSYRSQ